MTKDRITHTKERIIKNHVIVLDGFRYFVKEIDDGRKIDLEMSREILPQEHKRINDLLFPKNSVPEKDVEWYRNQIKGLLYILDDGEGMIDRSYVIEKLEMALKNDFGINLHQAIRDELGIDECGHKIEEHNDD